MYLCLNKLASKVWKRKCANFLYTMCKGGRKLELFFHSFSFPLLVMQRISSFIIKTGLFFFNKSAYALLVFCNWVTYMQISYMIPVLNTVGGKVSIQTSMELGSLEVIWDPIGGFRGWSLLKKFLDSKEQCEWKYTYTMLKLRVKQEIWVKDIITT